MSPWMFLPLGNGLVSPARPATQSFPAVGAAGSGISSRSQSLVSFDKSAPAGVRARLLAGRLVRRRYLDSAVLYHRAIGQRSESACGFRAQRVRCTAMAIACRPPAPDLSSKLMDRFGFWHGYRLWSQKREPRARWAGTGLSSLQAGQPSCESMQHPSRSSQTGNSITA